MIMTIIAEKSGDKRPKYQFRLIAPAIGFNQAFTTINHIEAARYVNAQLATISEHSLAILRERIAKDKIKGVSRG